MRLTKVVKVLVPLVFVFQANAKGESNANKDRDAMKDEDAKFNSNDLPIDLVKRLETAKEFLLKEDPHNKVQGVLMRYMRYFMDNDKMPMLTKSGPINVPITNEIIQNMRSLVEISINIETTRNDLIGNKYNLSRILDAFRFAYDNTVALDLAVVKVNASFTRHKDIEHPAMLRFYHAFKNDTKMVKKDDLDVILKIMVRKLDEAELTIDDIAKGRVIFDGWANLTTVDASQLAKILDAKNQTYAALFYQATNEKTRAMSSEELDDETVTEEIAEFYEDIGCACVNQYKETMKLVDYVKEAIEKQDEDGEKDEIEERKNAVTEGTESGQDDDNTDDDTDAATSDDDVDLEEDVDETLNDCEEVPANYCFEYIVKMSKLNTEESEENGSKETHDEL